jgi:hypothetical protein
MRMRIFALRPNTEHQDQSNRGDEKQGPSTDTCDPPLLLAKAPANEPTAPLPRVVAM